MRCAAPVASAMGGAITGEAAERGGNADGASCVRADGGYGGAFKDAGCCTGRRAAGEGCGIAWLHAVAEFGILAGDAVGQGMQMGFAGDDCSGGSRSRCEQAIESRDAGPFRVAIKLDAATCGRSGKIEAVFDGDGQTPEMVAAIAAEGARRGLSACGFRECPRRILPKIGVVTGIRIGSLECLRR